MAGKQEWIEVVELVRGAADPTASRHLPRLWALAQAEATRSLGALNDRLGKALVEELVWDLLAAELPAIVGAANPRAYFIRAICNRALSWIRSPRSMALPLDDGRVSRTPGAGVESDPVFLIDARAALARLPARERDVVTSAALGIDRDEIAAMFGTSRANVDQIVSRVRRRFREDDA